MAEDVGKKAGTAIGGGFGGPIGAFVGSKIGGALFDDDSSVVSGAFPSEQVGELGSSFGDFLLERLETPATETMQFDLGSKAIRDALSVQGATARQRLGDVANRGGFLDSGAVMSGLVDIERGQAQAFAQQITQLILALEDRREQNVLPFLSGAAGENVAIEGINVGAETAKRGQQFDFISDILSTENPS